MLCKYSLAQLDGMFQENVSEKLQYIDVIIDDNCSTRFEVSNGDYDFNLEKGDIAFEIDNETAIKLAKGILFALNAI